MSVYLLLLLMAQRRTSSAPLQRTGRRLQTHAHFRKGLSCDACHGPSLKHRTSTGAVPPDRVAAPDEVLALCGGCHSIEQKEYLESKHGKLVMARSRQGGKLHHLPRRPQPSPAAMPEVSCHSAIGSSGRGGRGFLHEPPLQQAHTG